MQCASSRLGLPAFQDCLCCLNGGVHEWATVVDDVLISVVLLQKKAALAGSCNRSPTLPNDDVFVRCLPRRWTCILEVHAEIVNLVADSLPSTNSDRARSPPRLDVVPLQAATAAALFSENQSCSETRAIVIDGGGGNRSVVSTGASVPRWRLDAQVLATLRVIRGAE